MIGVTGTNGKTSISYIVKAIAKANGISCGVIGTSGIYVDDEKLDVKILTSTTPDPIELHYALSLMVEKGAKPENILAAIGPCIGKCCYQVGQEVKDEFTSASAEYARFFTDDNEKGKYKLDLVKANAYILQTAGILPQNISCANLCTLCNEEHFFSHRRSGSLRGTLGAFIHI